MAACRYVKARTNLPNLEFVHDDAFNLPNYGAFDGVFCCGLLYHLDRPRQFLEMISAATTKLVILQTHFATDILDRVCPLPGPLRKLLAKMMQVLNRDKDRFQLSATAENERLLGRWYTEFPDDDAFGRREQNRWSSWDNRKSFWILREYLLQAILDVGFDLVMEQFDSLGPNIAESMLRGTYHTESRGTFIGIKTQSGQGF
jgi:SAM-dependent methyltransferase